MLQPSPRVRDAIKIAVAMTTAYGIALWLDWGKPAWAATAVAAVSLSSIGQSFNKSAMRMAGTLLAGAVALAVIGLFPQERWLFPLAIFSWIGFCTYMMMGPRQQYFWQVSGFVAAVVCVGSAGDLEGAFSVAVLRLQETGLGILVFSLVALFLWPVSSRTAFEAALKDLIASQRAFCAASFSGQEQATAEPPATTPAPKLLAQIAQQRTQVAQLFAAAATDSYAIEAERSGWERVVAAAGALGDALRRFEDVAADLADVPNDGLAGLEQFGRALEARFAIIEQLLDSDAVAVEPAPPLLLQEQKNLELTHFQRAAVVVIRERCGEIHRAVDALVEALRELHSGAEDRVGHPAPRAPLLPDPDRLIGALRAMAACWIVYLMWINIEALPGGVMAVTFAAVFSMIAASMPQLPLSKILWPGLTGVLLAATVTIFVMPHLEGFVGLGALIFAFTFLITYHFSEPAQALGRTFGLAMFAVIANISNEQSYSFLAIVNTALMFPIVFLAIALTAFVPLSLQPADAFRRLLQRFFLCSVLLVRAHRGTLGSTPLQRWRWRLWRDQLARTPAKLAAWTAPAAAQLGVAPETLLALQRAVQALADGLLELEASSPLSPELASACDLPTWQTLLEKALSSLQADPQGGVLAMDRERLVALGAEFRERLDAVMTGTTDHASDPALYGMVGAYRGVVRSVLDYLAHASAVDRAAWYRRAFP